MNVTYYLLHTIYVPVKLVDNEQGVIIFENVGKDFEWNWMSTLTFSLWSLKDRKRKLKLSEVKENGN